MPSDRFIRRALLLDAAATGATALLALAAAGPLGEWFSLPETLLRIVGAGLLPFVGFVAWAGTRAAVPAGAVRTIVAVNIAWVVASLGLLLGPWVAPSTLGVVFVVAQATIVAVFAELQVIGLKKLAPAAA